jgi:hypothetical protein
LDEIADAVSARNVPFFPVRKSAFENMDYNDGGGTDSCDKAKEIIGCKARS